jgi:hypothetical protein
VSDEILTVDAARKRLAEIKQLSASKKAPLNVGQLAVALEHEIIETIATHGDVRSRGLAAVLKELCRRQG